MKNVAYYRVSTDKQKRSGLGLEAQQAAVREYLTGNGWPPVAEFIETESGKDNDRPELAKALHACRVHRATLVIAKLDRLSRNAAFLLRLRDEGVEFVACDMPTANRLTVTIMAAVAEDEAERISARTKVALAAAKARGTVLGGWRGNKRSIPSDAQRSAAAASKAAKADQFAEDLRPIIAELRAEGIESNRALAAALTRRDIATSTGKKEWQATTVARLIKRLEK